MRGWIRVGVFLSSYRGQCWRLQKTIEPTLPFTPSTSFYSSHCTTSFSMSQTPSALASASTSSSNFQSIFNAALKAYAKKTKTDLLAHPLAEKLKACNSSGDILAVLQDKVNEFDQSRSSDERLSQWLNPTINVLYSLSATIGAGVGLVSSVSQLVFF
jgi:hypothetical protein